MRTRIARFVVVVAGMALLVAAPVQAATITVSTTSDEVPFATDGDCTLREAVQAANTNTAVDGCTAGTLEADKITLPAGTFELSGAPADDLNLSGDLDAQTSSTRGPLTIDGAGMTSTTIAAGATQDRVIHSLPSLGGTPPMLSLEDLTVSGGGAPTLNSGGGILVSNSTGALNLTRVQVRDNQALNGAGVNAGGTLNVTDSLIGPDNNSPSPSSGGGGIFSSAELTMTGSEVFENSAFSGGGGIRLNSGSDGGSLIQDSAVRDNSASSGGSGAGISSGNATGDLTIEDSQITGNQTSAATGGGIYYDPGTAKTLRIRRSEVSNNRSSDFGGGLGVDPSAAAVIENSVFADNRIEPASGGGSGGAAIEADGSALDIRDSSFTGNRVAATIAGVGAVGVVIHLEGGATSTIRRSLFTQNTATGVANARGVFFTEGSAANRLDIVNSTVSGNPFPASLSAAAVVGGDTGATVNLANVTVTGNTPNATPRAFPPAVDLSVHLKNSIFDHGTDAAACGGAVDDGGNVERGDSCAGFPAADSNVDPMLGPLADNGGPTLSHKPAVGSPVIDRIIAANCTDQAAVPAAITDDQRGAPRPTGTDCDIGAHEVTDEKIVIGLSTIPSGLSNQFPFSSDIDGNTAFSLAHGGERVIDDPVPGTNTVTAAAQSGFGTSVDCNDDGSATPSTVAGGTATIELDFNETVRCDYVRTKDADPPLPPPPGDTLTLTLAAKAKLPPGKLRAKATCSVACTVLASVKGKAGGDKFKSPKSSSSIPAGVPTKVSVALKRKVLKQVEGEKGAGTFTAIATAGGQTSVAKDPFELK